LITESFLWVAERFPSVRRYMWRGFFEFSGSFFHHAEFWTFMNYGYADDTMTLPKLKAADWDERYAAYLYHRVASRADLKDRDVLEVSSGRGGGASYVKRYLGPRWVVGLDIAASAVAFCRRVHKVEGLEFQQGDAEHLPFADRSFDAVINVEASFCYPSIDRFYAEVRRVLRPGGHFLYADLRWDEELLEFDRALAASGLEMIERSEITQNVAAALELDSDRRRTTNARHCPRLLQSLFDKFIGVSGTRIPRDLGSGKMRYFACVLRKPA
jgi:SAM-dependent methyltransferase